MTDLITKIADDLKLKLPQVEAAIALLKEEYSVPFIAHYRRDRTGGLTSARLRAIKERFDQLNEMEQRRAAAIKAITEAGAMTPELQTKLETITNRAELEDIYMPFRSRRRVRSTAAKQKGLEPLADLIWKQATTAPGAEAKAEGAPAGAEAAAAPVNAEAIVKPYINAEKGVKDLADALAGARDIVAERIAEDAACRKIARDLLHSEGKMTTKAREGIDLAKGKYAAFAQWSEPLTKLPSHKVLTAARGAGEKQLSVVIEAPREKIVNEIKARLMTNPDALLKPELALAIEECFDRLLGPALDNEFRQELKKRVDSEAIAICTKNLRALLMQPPLGNKAVLAIDASPGAGMKVAVLDGSGKLVTHTVLTPEKSEDEKKSVAETLVKLVKENNVAAIALSSGPGSREADVFARETLKTAELKDVFTVVVHAHGTPQPIREDLNDIDAAARSAVLLGRRLQDPLLEMAKLDPTTINVGPHQHDVDQAQLKQKLEETVEDCINEVGVDANLAPASILRYVSGIGPALATQFTDSRKAKGNFKTRDEIREGSGLAPKNFEQSIGFLRVKDSANPLDNTAVHPEWYPVVEAIAASVNVPAKDLLGNADALQKVEIGKFKNEQVSEHALAEILDQLRHPGRDPRGEFVKPEFNEELKSISDLKEGMIVSGVVTNLTTFGAFVDVGVHQDGLVHISAITHKFIRDASEVLTVGQRVKVKVLSADAEKKRISLSMKELEQAPQRQPRRGSASGEARPPRPPRPPRAPRVGPDGKPVEVAAGQGAPGGRPERRPFRPRPPRREGAPGQAPAAAATGVAAGSAAGTPGPEANKDNHHARRFRDKREGAGAGGGDRNRGNREGGRDRKPFVKPPEPGKPDYSKFFVKGKRKERDKKKEARPAEGASRDEVRQVLRQQESGGTTLADLLRKAGVATDDSK